MFQSTCLYSELEPYSGSIRYRSADLARLLRDLKIACLFYDVVVIHRRNLWEHPLTLPAFEALAPFVKSGQLWASANEFDALPQDYVVQKMRQLDVFFGKGYLKKSNTVNEIEERWLKITPTDWRVRRSANQQTHSVLHNIDSYLVKFKSKRFKSLHSLINFVEKMRANNDFNKELILAKLGRLRSQIHMAELAEIATLIQVEYLRAGADFNQNAVIYPGKSAQYLNSPNFIILPFAINPLQQAQKCAQNQNLHFDLEKLLNLPITVLFEVSQMSIWKVIRDNLLNNSFEMTIRDEINSICTAKFSFAKQLEQLLTLTHLNKSPKIDLPEYSPSLLMPSPWSLSSQSLLGNAHVSLNTDTLDDQPDFILDISSRVLTDTTTKPLMQVDLTARQTDLLSILVSAGHLGLTIEHIKQLYLEFERVAWKIPQWQTQNELAIEYQDLLRNKMDVFKKEFNKKLQLFGLKINAELGKGRWYLASENNKTVVKLVGTTWSNHLVTKTVEIPIGLSKQSKAIWQCLLDYSPQFVNAKKLAEVLEKPWNERTPRQISDAVYKLKKSLQHQPWVIKQSHIGEYALVPDGSTQSNCEVQPDI